MVIIVTNNNSVLKGKEILTYATAWLNLKHITLSEIDTHKNPNTALFHLYEGLKAVNLKETESRMNGSCQGLWGRGNGDSYLMVRVSVL